MRLMLVQTVLLAALLVMTAPAGAITFADGMSHEVDAVNTYPFESVAVLDAPGGSPTTVHVLPGGQIGTLTPGGTLHAFGNSLISVSGGLISVLQLRDNASHRAGSSRIGPRRSRAARKGVCGRRGQLPLRDGEGHRDTTLHHEGHKQRGSHTPAFASPTSTAAPTPSPNDDTGSGTGTGAQHATDRGMLQPAGTSPP